MSASNPCKWHVVGYPWWQCHGGRSPESPCRDSFLICHAGIWNPCPWSRGRVHQKGGHLDIWLTGKISPSLSVGQSLLILKSALDQNQLDSLSPTPLENEPRWNIHLWTHYCERPSLYLGWCLSRGWICWWCHHVRSCVICQGTQCMGILLWHDWSLDLCSKKHSAHVNIEHVKKLSDPYLCYYPNQCQCLKQCGPQLSHLAPRWLHAIPRDIQMQVGGEGPSQMKLVTYSVSSGPQE